tara:strand:+ start:568 stop:1725 length:1158 start_codon:yes stop_codon:yes gene_type:complete
MKRKICVITGTRAEYGLLRFLMKSIKSDSKLTLQIIATGMHLSPDFGFTFREIENDGFKIDEKFEMLLSADTPSSISKSTALGLISFSDIIQRLDPDIVVLLGDRFEILAASISALFAKIPIAHIHGGETTTGAYDEAIRHSVSKMAYWHFVANEVYKKRIIQLGEDPKRVHNVGGLGIDAIIKTNLLSKKQLAKELKLEFLKKNLMITFHPETLENSSSQQNFSKILKSLEKLKDTLLIFTMPNADSDGRVIKAMINDFVLNQHPNSVAFTSLGRRNYLSALQFVDAVVGNSSSGLLEAPYFNIGTINVGDRQSGRIKADSVIDCNYSQRSISHALEKLYDKRFQKKLLNTSNLYGEGNSSDKIKKILKNVKIPTNLKKTFYDL